MVGCMMLRCSCSRRRRPKEMRKTGNRPEACVAVESHHPHTGGTDRIPPFHHHPDTQTGRRIDCCVCQQLRGGPAFLSSQRSMCVRHEPVMSYEYDQRQAEHRRYLLILYVYIGYSTDGVYSFNNAPKSSCLSCPPTSRRSTLSQQGLPPHFLTTRGSVQSQRVCPASFASCGKCSSGKISTQK